MYTDCIVPTYGHRNKDGYVRVLTKPRRLGGKLVMKHRVEWEIVNGPIPYGHEINHKCKNRECCNVKHLECLTASAHKTLDNSMRYLHIENEILKLFEDDNNLSTREVANRIGYSMTGARKLLNRIKRKTNGS